MSPEQKICILHCKMHIFCIFLCLESIFCKIVRVSSSKQRNLPKICISHCKMHIFALGTLHQKLHISQQRNMQKICILQCKMHIFLRWGHSIKNCIFSKMFGFGLPNKEICKKYAFYTVSGLFLDHPKMHIF